VLSAVQARVHGAALGSPVCARDHLGIGQRPFLIVAARGRATAAVVMCCVSARTGCDSVWCCCVWQAGIESRPAVDVRPRTSFAVAGGPDRSCGLPTASAPSSRVSADSDGRNWRAGGRRPPRGRPRLVNKLLAERLLRHRPRRGRHRHRHHARVLHDWAAVLRADPRWATWHRGPSALNCGSTGGDRADQIVAVRAASCSVKAGTDWPARSAQALITATAAASA
jgi:hypothetical protein